MAERAAGTLIRGLIASGELTIVHDLSDGGLAVAAAEMAMASNMGIALSNSTEVPDHAFYFGEDQGRYLIALSADRLDVLDEACAAAKVGYEVVGTSGGCELALFGAGGALIVSADVEDLTKVHEGWMPAYMAAPT